MRNLLIDNSNTRTKFAISQNGIITEWHKVVPTKDISRDSLAKTLKNTEWDTSTISSVVPHKANILKEFLSSKQCHLLSHLSNLPIDIAYPKPEQIGADRLANATAAYQIYGCPAVVLDFGTAVTFDVVANYKERASYLGGVIAPGLASMTEGLANRAALLPHIQLEEPEHAIGKSTEEAMLSGAVYGYRGLVREILQNICKELSANPAIIATGGDAKLITKGLPEIHHLDPLLTLKGLQIIAELNS